MRNRNTKLWKSIKYNKRTIRRYKKWKIWRDRYRRRKKNNNIKCKNNIRRTRHGNNILFWTRNIKHKIHIRRICRTNRKSIKRANKRSSTKNKNKHNIFLERLGLKGSDPFVYFEKEK